MKFEKLLRLGLHAVYLQRRWRLWSARAAGSLRNVFVGDYKGKKESVLKTLRIHSKGWGVDDWRVCGGGMDSARAMEYLSTADYRRMHPLNGAYSSWIDDKLTLMYLCQSPDLKNFMPDYYFQVSGDAALALPDCPEDLRGVGAEGILGCLERFGELALKQVRGSLGEGFYKVEMRDGSVFVNGGGLSRDEFLGFVSGLDGYIATEYLHPHPSMSAFCSATANTVRYLVADVQGEPLFLRAFIRFGTARSGFVENYNAGGVLCFADEEGHYWGGNVIDLETGVNKRLERHPDTNAVLDGEIPLWGEMQDAVHRFCSHFPQLEYLGFDFVASDKGVKLLEINSLSSLDCIQLDGSVFDLPNGSWFRERLDVANGKA